MDARAHPVDAAFVDEIDEVHAADVARARALILEAVATADAEWLPRNATVQALLSVLREMARGASGGFAQPDRFS
jgi:hypothetical protein